MIPPPPPPLNRRPSYVSYGCVMQPVASGPELPTHADQQTMHEPTPGLIGSGGNYNNVMNQPDLFNFASNTNTNTNGSLSGTLKSTLKSTKSSSSNGKTTSASSATNAAVDGKSKLNEPLPVMMVDLMNGNTNDPPGAKSPYPPYYFDDNYLHHQYYYGSAGHPEPTADVPLKEAMDPTGQLYLYHQHHHHHHHPDPVTGGYIPNYDTLNLPSKYNTIGANGDLSGHFSGLGGGVGHHASFCNINQYAGGSVAKSNLISSHNHHFSNSISNFNFNPSQYFGSVLDPPPGTTIIPGGLGGVMGGGDGFPSSCSLNGTPNKQQHHPWKHRQCPSRGSSSTGSGSSNIVQAHKNRQMCSLIGVEGGHSLGVSLGVLRTFYALGVRYLTITATCHTPWADSSNADAPKYDVRHGGLTAYGKQRQPQNGTYALQLSKIQSPFLQPSKRTSTFYRRESTNPFQSEPVNKDKVVLRAVRDVPRRWMMIQIPSSPGRNPQTHCKKLQMQIPFHMAGGESL
uniref:Dipeptidase n=1 Tax=Anopheles farauti TaxID=69004 RepID=A0A182Q2L3_9DIPT